MIDYKIKNRIDKIVQKCSIGGTIGDRYAELKALGMPDDQIYNELQNEFSMVDLDTFYMSIEPNTTENTITSEPDPVSPTKVSRKDKRSANRIAKMNGLTVEFDDNGVPHYYDDTLAKSPVTEQRVEVDPNNEDLMANRQYAASKGYFYDQNANEGKGGFYKRDESGQILTNDDGSFVMADVDPSEITAFTAGQAADAATAQQNMQNAQVIMNRSIQRLDKLLQASPNVSNQSALTQGIQGGLSQVGNFLGATGTPWGKIAQTAIQLDQFGTHGEQALGLKNDGLTTADQIYGSELLLNTLANVKTKTTDKISLNRDMASILGGSYSYNDILKAQNKSGKEVSWLSNRGYNKIQKQIDDAKKKQSKMEGIAKEASYQNAMVSSLGDQQANAYGFKMTGGYNQKYTRASKFGGVIPDNRGFIPKIFNALPEKKKITPGAFALGGQLKDRIDPDVGGIVSIVKPDGWEPVIESFVPKIMVDSFKPGGRIEKTLDAPEIEETEQKSVIPEGSLHKDKHHMENTEGMTKKGIPVVDDDSKQQAEIERNEIIFTKEVTKKLEELYKVYYDDDSSAKEKDEAAIDAGKLLTKEIMLNTDDRTGLIDTLKKGGSIKSQTDKSPVKKTEVVGAGPAGFEWMVDMTEKPSYEEWVKDVNPDYMSDNYDLKKAFEVLPFGELQRWKKVIGTPLENQLPVETWHLPSVWFDRDNDVGVFLKKGQTAEENPELQYEFDAYNSNPEMQKEWKMVYDPEEGRWMYVRR